MSCVLQRVYKSVWHAIKSFNEFVRLPIALFVVFATILIVKSYHFYIPPKFNTGFLAGRETYFFSTPYAVGFYLHIVGAPLALIAGTLQFSRTILKRLPKLHRTLGRTAIISTIGFATPGGLIMAFGTRAGSSALLCFLVMNLLTAWFAWMAWRTAVARRFVDHRRWAWRCYLMLASAILLRIIDPVLRETGVPDLQSYRLSIWLSWLPSLVCYEILHSRWSMKRLPCTKLFHRTKARWSKMSQQSEQELSEKPELIFKRVRIEIRLFNSIRDKQTCSKM